MSAVRERLMAVAWSSMMLLQQRDGARRGGDDALRPAAEAQGELQRVPGVVGPAPLAELVAPGGVELRPAQAVGIVGGEHLGDGAVGPDELVPGDLELGALVGRIDRQQARHALDHDAAHLGDGVADEGDAARAAVGERRLAERLGAHPFGAGAGLAGAAAAEHEPRVPGPPPLARSGGSWSSRANSQPVVDGIVPLLASSWKASARDVRHGGISFSRRSAISRRRASASDAAEPGLLAVGPPPAARSRSASNSLACDRDFVTAVMGRMFLSGSKEAGLAPRFSGPSPASSCAAP